MVLGKKVFILRTEVGVSDSGANLLAVSAAWADGSDRGFQKSS